MRICKLRCSQVSASRPSPQPSPLSTGEREKDRSRLLWSRPTIADPAVAIGRPPMNRFIIEVSTDGNTEIVNLSPELNARLRGIDGEGLVHLFIAGSTAA